MLTGCSWIFVQCLFEYVFFIIPSEVFSNIPSDSSNDDAGKYRGVSNNAKDESKLFSEIFLSTFFAHT
jgi:hypothetical protein